MEDNGRAVLDVDFSLFFWDVLEGIDNGEGFEEGIGFVCFDAIGNQKDN